MKPGRTYQDNGIYQIKIRGFLDEGWSEWFDDFSVTPQSEHLTVLVGQVQDQGALFGLLAKIRDLGLPLLSVEQLEEPPGE